MRTAFCGGLYTIECMTVRKEWRRASSLHMCCSSRNHNKIKTTLNRSYFKKNHNDVIWYTFNNLSYWYDFVIYLDFALNYASVEFTRAIELSTGSSLFCVYLTTYSTSTYHINWIQASYVQHMVNLKMKIKVVKRNEWLSD